VSSGKIASNSLKNLVEKTIEVRKPKNVANLFEFVQEKQPFEKEALVSIVKELREEGKIELRLPPLEVKSYLDYLKAKEENNWFFCVVAAALATIAAVYLLPSQYPIIMFRWVLGSIFVLFLPGYTFIKALFPTKELDNIERAALSMGMSIALVPITGLILNYTPWGIRTTPVTLSLLALTTIFATAAIIREHQTKLRIETT